MEEIILQKKEFLQKIRNLKEYHVWKEKVMKLKRNECEFCKISGGLQLHHKKSLGEIIRENKIISLGQAKNCKDMWNINNAILLCTCCHLNEHYGGYN